MPDPSPTEPSRSAPKVHRIGGSRRVVRPGAPGADPTPQGAGDAVRAAEDVDSDASASNSNDAWLKQDVPPHWG